MLSSAVQEKNKFLVFNFFYEQIKFHLSMKKVL